MVLSKIDKGNFIHYTSTIWLPKQGYGNNNIKRSASIEEEISYGLTLFKGQGDCYFQEWAQYLVINTNWSAQKSYAQRNIKRTEQAVLKHLCIFVTIIIF